MIDKFIAKFFAFQKKRNQDIRNYQIEIETLRKTIKDLEDKKIFSDTTVDLDWDEKVDRVINDSNNFGKIDFSHLSTWLFASSLINHRVVHQRIDEGSSLWRAVKSSAGPILEVGRAAGGSTLILLGASGSRPVTSIDRAPFHAWCADKIFERNDIKTRLTLLTQTSREEIKQKNFGMIFIDADHSYEGICHDIAMFWNDLSSHDGKPAIAAFHDGASNPITFVEPVKRACDELLAENGVARKVESWGSMLILEKLGNIDSRKWFAKEHTEFWEQFDRSGKKYGNPPDQENISSFFFTKDKVLSDDLFTLRSGNYDDWNPTNLNMEKLPLNADNPIRLFRETRMVGSHGFSRNLKIEYFNNVLTMFFRPLGISSVEFVFEYKGEECIKLKLDCENSRIFDLKQLNDDLSLADSDVVFRSGFFRIRIGVISTQVCKEINCKIFLLDDSLNREYAGDTKKGIFLNLFSFRGF